VRRVGALVVAVVTSGALLGAPNDPSAGSAVIEASDGAQAAITVTDSRISFVTSASKDGATEESVVEMRLRKGFSIKAPAKKSRSTGDPSFSVTIPGVPGGQ